MPWNPVLAAGSVAGLAALAGRYAAGAARVGRAWPVRVEARLSDLGAVDEVSVLPLVERLVPEGVGLTGEPGVSYLIRVGCGCCSTPACPAASHSPRSRATPRYWARPWATWTPW